MTLGTRIFRGAGHVTQFEKNGTKSRLIEATPGRKTNEKAPIPLPLWTSKKTGLNSFGAKNGLFDFAMSPAWTIEGPDFPPEGTRMGKLI